MKINWKLRGQNKATLVAIATLALQILYRVFDAVGIIPPVTQEWVMEIVQALLSMLVLLGVIVDPTTKGVGDSDRAMSYKEPWVDKDNL